MLLFLTETDQGKEEKMPLNRAKRPTSVPKVELFGSKIKNEVWFEGGGGAGSGDSQLGAQAYVKSEGFWFSEPTLVPVKGP